VNFLRSTGVFAADGPEFPSATHLLVHREQEVIPLQHLYTRMFYITQPLSSTYVHVQREIPVHTEPQSSERALLFRHDLPD